MGTIVFVGRSQTNTFSLISEVFPCFLNEATNRDCVCCENVYQMDSFTDLAAEVKIYKTDPYFHLDLIFNVRREKIARKASRHVFVKSKRNTLRLYAI